VDFQEGEKDIHTDHVKTTVRKNIVPWLMGLPSDLFQSQVMSCLLLLLLLDTFFLCLSHQHGSNRGHEQQTNGANNSDLLSMAA
jgi:hypothetical protein